MISYAELTVIATTIQAVLFGLYLTTFFLCLRWLMFVDNGWTIRKDIKWSMLTVTIVIFVFSTIILALCLEATLLVSQPLVLMGIIILFIEAFTVVIADAVLIYRCWIVYYKSWPIVALPILLLLFNLSCVIAYIYLGTVDLPVITPAHYTGMGHIREVFDISTVIIHVYATSAIIFQIWRNCISRHLLRFAIRVIAESGLLYTLASATVRVYSLLTKVPPFAPSTPQIVATAIDFPIVGIAFNLILIRAAQHRVDPRVGGNSSIELNVNVIVENRMRSNLEH